MKHDLINIAAAFDDNDISSAENLLVGRWYDNADITARRVLLGYWRRLYSLKESGHSSEVNLVHALAPFFSKLEKALLNDDFWPLLEVLNQAEDLLGAKQLCDITLCVLWDKLPSAPFGFQYDVMTRVFIGGDINAHQTLFAHLLREDKGFVPDFWQFQSLVRSWSEAGVADANIASSALLDSTKRSNLETLFQVYLSFVLQTYSERGFELAETLVDDLQKARVASYLLGASQSKAMMPLAVKLHNAICDDKDEKNFMSARLSLVSGDWEKVISLTGGLVNHIQLKNESVCLRALALAHTGDFDNSAAALNHVRYGGNAPWFLNARASLINVARRRLKDEVPLPNDVKSPAMTVKSGQPLAQSLWVGAKLRWIEEMSMRSFLANGWRYQLYAYEPIENIPEGVEVLDASAILPRSMIFKEGANSGMHKGSVGAFSDLFRYALLSKRGGMWTDTDVINLRRFDPDGKRFISTEWSDAGLIGLNGAMMAAPAGDELQLVALERAKRLLDEGGSHFARIGPELLAELIGDGDFDKYTLLPTDFLNPIGWMETGKLLRPFSEMKGAAFLTSAFNIHVYTETWRLLGLSLSAPPQGDGFLSVLYDRLMNLDASKPYSVKNLLR